jgi:uncharacterized glyoxalase superfamily protein PhnB
MRAISSSPVLAVHDLEGMAGWFERVLGCTRREADPGNWVFCTVGDVTFMLGRCPGTPLASAIGDHSYLAYLVVDDVDAFHSRAVAEGLDNARPPTDQPWGMREISLHTPEGHRFMLGQRL